jgi:RNA polymerase sigma-70 factor (family 1)
MADLKKFSDVELLNLLRDSDHAAYGEIFRRYFYLIFTHAYRKLGDEERAKDVVQDVFATLWFNRESNLPVSNLAGYLYAGVRNKIFDLFAHEQVKTRHVESLKAYLSVHGSAATDHRIRENQLRAYIDREIEALPPKMRRIFEMSRKEHLSHKEIAEQLGVSENNVSKQVNNALRILRTKLGLIIYLYFLFN